MSDWKTSACILCECNCGIEVQLGGKDEREIVRIRGDKAHPASRGYLCQKASGLNYYQNGKDRLTSPLRRRADGSFEAIDWDTAIREVSERLLSLRDREGGERIFYYGGGGQGNHLPGGYATATRRVLGMQYRSNALAQEKTGEFWVNGMMFGAHVKGDFEHCEVAIFLGKNPWHSHGLPRARAWLRDFSKDPARTLIVIDPVVTETAEFADIHLQVKPGTDAWLLAAMLGMLVQQGKYRREWLAEHSTGLEPVLEAFGAIPVEAYCAIAGLNVAQVQQAVDVISGAASVAMAEDLGVQMNRHSTLVSYLEKLLWALCGQFGHPGGQYIPASLQNIAGSGRSSRKSPVAGAPIISGLVPCNVIAEEILSDHPDRYRAMLIESANPAHSLADSRRFAAGPAQPGHGGGHRHRHDRDRPAGALCAARRHPVREMGGYVLQFRDARELFSPAQAPVRRPRVRPAGGGDPCPAGGGDGWHAGGAVRRADRGAGAGRTARLPGAIHASAGGSARAGGPCPGDSLPHPGPEPAGWRRRGGGVVAGDPGFRHAGT